MSAAAVPLRTKSSATAVTLRICYFPLFLNRRRERKLVCYFNRSADPKSPGILPLRAIDRRPGFCSEIEVIRRNPEKGVEESGEASATPAELRWKGVRVRAFRRK